MSRSPDEELAEFKHSCSWLLTAYAGDETLESAVAGLYYAMKSTRIVPRVVEALLAGNPAEVVSSGRGDDACYVADTMVRAVHSSGDLLAQAVNYCVCEPRMGVAGVTLHGVKRQVERQAEATTDAHLKSLYVLVAKELDDLAKSPDYIYVGDFTNTSKHQAFINRMLITSDDGCDIVFNAFTRNDRSETREHNELSFVAVCAIVGNIRDACGRVVKLMEQWKNYEAVTNSKTGSVVGTFLSLTATPQVMTKGEFTFRTFRSEGDSIAGSTSGDE